MSDAARTCVAAAAVSCCPCAWVCGVFFCVCVWPEQGVCFPSCVLLRLLCGVLCEISGEKTTSHLLSVFLTSGTKINPLSVWVEGQDNIQIFTFQTGTNVVVFLYFVYICQRKTWRILFLPTHCFTSSGERFKFFFCLNLGKIVLLLRFPLNLLYTL